MTMLDRSEGQVEDVEGRSLVKEGGEFAGRGGALEPGGLSSDACGEAGGSAVGGVVLPPEVLERLGRALAEQAAAGEVALTGPGGLLSGVMSQVLQAGLSAELDAHLGYGRHVVAGQGSSGNSRNGSVSRRLLTEAGPLQVAVPRDRAGTFASNLVPKGVRRTAGLDAAIISLYAKGMSTRDIEDHVRESMGMDISRDTVSRITDAALEDMRAWQARPLESMYPVVFIDALVAKVRDGSAVRNKAVNIAIGVDTEGIKHVLGIWVAPAEGAKAWAQALHQMRNRGLEDVLIVCCDGLAGLGEEIVATWPQATVQTCCVHLIRASTRFAGYQDRKRLCAAIRPVYTAADADAAQLALLEFADSPLGKKYPSAVATWERAWDRFIPFLEFPPEVRKVIYTTNAIVISSLN